jgi:hemerythrin superfamily protein
MAYEPQSGVATTLIEMLKEDHQKVKALFEEFEGADDSKTKQRIVETALMELDVHAKLEEGLVYPAVREEIDDEDLMDEALEEHHVVHVLIAELKKMKPSDDRFDAKFTVLAENVKHHIKEEESEMLPKAEGLDIDWESLEQQVLKRKERLMTKASGRSRNGTARTNNRTAKKSRTRRKTR